jgi:ankyrin repeat protein
MKTKNNMLWIVFYIMLMCIPISRAWPDGGFFSSRSVAVSADQRAIIMKNGDEISMTFYTGYTGEGEEFTWIIPTPVPVAIENVNETGEDGVTAFRLLQEYTAPKITDGTKGGGGWGAPPPEDPLSAVTVYGRVTLEHYEVSILGAAAASPLLAWLQSEGYEVDPAAERVLDVYIRENWAFVAIKLNPSERRHYQNEFMPPLTVNYRHDQLIFPLRISSVSTNEPIKITLYVIAESTASSSNHPTSTLKYTEQPFVPLYPESYIESCVEKTNGLQGGRGLVVLWRGEFDAATINGLIKTHFSDSQGAYLTRLEARMSPTDMKEDIVLILDMDPKPFSVDIHAIGGYYSALASAAWAGRTQQLQILLEDGADVNDADNGDDWTPIMMAARGGHSDVVEILLAANAQLNVVDAYGMTALRWAERGGHVDIVRRLLHAGADAGAGGVRFRLTEYIDTLSWAARRGHIDVVQMLLEAGADVNSVVSGTALSSAVQSGNVDLVRILLEAGADMPDFLAMRNAIAYGHTEIVRILLESGADSSPAGLGALLSTAALNGRTRLVQLLLKRGADVNAKNSNNETALHDAVWHKTCIILRILLEAGADVNVKGNQGKTALMYAAQFNNIRAIRMLLEAGADVNAKNVFGRTALDSTWNGAEGEEARRLFREYGAK